MEQESSLLLKKTFRFITKKAILNTIPSLDMERITATIDLHIMAPFMDMMVLIILVKESLPLSPG